MDSNLTLLTSVQADLTFIVPGADKPWNYQYEPPQGVERHHGNYVATRVSIADGRPLRGAFSLDVQGFELLHSPTLAGDLYDPDELQRVYYPETANLVKSVTGAEDVLVFDHTIRSNAPDRRGAQGIREAVRRVHNDYTDKSAPQRIRDLLPPAEAERRLRKRYAFINVWRPIAGPLEETPLALADARSIKPKDLIASDLIYRERTGETYAVAHNRDQRWFWFPRMERDEVVLIKCYDSAPGHAKISAHTAFDDPTAPANPRPRESIEIRTIAFWD
ncbi:MAG: CmcJ/NvfI family oxidoreductase [Reyranellaceae bacterium]